MAFLICTVVLIVSVTMIIKSYIESANDKTAFLHLAAAVSQAQESEKIYGTLGITADLLKPYQSESDTVNVPEETQYTEYAVLYEKNSDFAGWLHIDNTEIDYPVMYTPVEPEYYLHRAFDKTYSQSGTPFISQNSTIDSDFFIIYGHNMKNNTMFGTLDHYAEKTFWEESPFLSFTTITEQREYEIFAALETRVLYQTEPGYRYYFQVGNLTAEAFDKLISWFQANALYDTGITPVYGEQIVVLSTCSYHEDNGRFIIAARKIDSETE